MNRPLLDAFGTRLQPDALVAGLLAFEVPALHLAVGDDAITLRIAGADPGGDAASRAITWVRGQFSPLLRCDVVVDPTLLPGVAVVDERRRLPVTIALAEVTSEAFDAAIDGLIARLTAPEGAPAPIAVPEVADPEVAGLLSRLAAAWSAGLSRAGLAGGTLAWLEPTRAGVSPIVGGPGAGPHLVAWRRPGGATGVRPALILTATTETSALRWLVAALADPPVPLPDVPVLLDGLSWSAARRPTIAAPASPLPIVVDDARCSSCGLCAKACPTSVLDDHGRVKPAAIDACLRCMDCVDACPEDALRPTYAADSATRGELPLLADGWLARLRGAPGPAEPAPFPPSYLTPRKSSGTPRVVLGLAVMTQQEHAAALVIDGVLVGAIEEEKLVRVRHYGWKPSRGPSFRNLGVDPTLQLEQVLCRRSIRRLLDEHGLTLDDVDLFALNGLPSRYRAALPILDADVPVPVLHAGRVVAVPHHLCHAASAFRVSGLDAAWILTVDGRGDRETAALFRADGDAIRPVRTLLSLTDRSIGGVYETVTRLLGFGSHGQGSVMALAALGTPDDRLAPWLSARGWDDVSVHEQGLQAALADLARSPDDPLEDRHRDLAASLQHALEQTLVALARDGVGEGPVDALCLAGGVTLNCKANDLLRTALGAERVWAQPGANDGGTAIGAAAEAWARTVGGNLAPMRTASLGPAFDDVQIARALRRAGVEATRVDDVAEAVAERLTRGEVVAWFQDRLEFGPRALGARSLLADPRDAALHGRVNRLKDREPWRPFAPSILAGHEADWFEGAYDSPFMLFTQTVRPERRAQVPVIVHDDGSTRPQVVHEDTHPLYHRLISAFHRRTGVPIVVDTSFNRRGEPIVARPEDALDAFAGLGADVLAIGSFLVERGAKVAAPGPVEDDAALAVLPGGRRLMLRVTTRCELACGHCTLRDHATLGVDARADDVTRSLAEGRKAGCDELVLMRGEPLLRADLPEIVRRARRMGYRFVQVQTHGRAFADERRLRVLRDAGVDAAEVMLLGADALVHDAIAQVDGAFRETVAGIQLAVRAGIDVLVTVPVLRRNAVHLPRVIALVGKLGVRRAQLQFPRPVETVEGIGTDELLRLRPAAGAANRAARQARGLGIEVSTEGFPLCRLEPWLWGTPDATEDFGRHRIDDLGVVHDAFGEVRTAMRPEAEVCRGCGVRERCPKPWAAYTDVFGTAELIAQSAAD